jgi:hypothetical protein
MIVDVNVVHPTIVILYQLAVMIYGFVQNQLHVQELIVLIGILVVVHLKMELAKHEQFA